MEDKPPTPEEKAAADAARDIAANVTAGTSWRDYDLKYAVSRILRAIRSVAGSSAVLVLFIAPAFAGTVTCAGKVYRDVTYATLAANGGIEVVSLWVGEVRDDTAIKRVTPKFTLILSSEMMCELQDVALHIVSE